MEYLTEYIYQGQSRIEKSEFPRLLKTSCNGFMLFM
jgi:hypothetical protein